jgi:hypothetical protein
MTARAIVGVLALVAACGGDPGRRFDLEVVPTERALGLTDELEIALVRDDDGARRDFRFELPAGTPGPWSLRVETRDWRDTPLVIQATALAQGVVIADGRAAGAGTTVRVVLTDVEPNADGGAQDQGVDAHPAVARLVAPTSGGIVQRPRPGLRFDLLDARGAHLELCRERTCAAPIESIALAPGASQARPSAALPRGVVFWRLVDRRGRATPPWSFVVPAGASDALPDTISGVVLDVNGDGWSDVAVGAPSTPIGTDGLAGRVHVYLGGSDGVSATRVQTIDGTYGASIELGRVVAAAGDVDGDGYGDLAVGLPALGSGQAVVYLGGPDGIDATRARTIPSSDGAQAAFASSVAAAGDLDEDGYADLLVGAPGYSTLGDGNGPGRIHVFFGGPDLSRPPLAIDGSAGPASRFGEGVAGAADFDGDGHLDAAVGAPRQSSSMTVGRVVLYFGQPSGQSSLDPSRRSTYDGGAKEGFASKLVLGDLDRDGRAELIAGAPSWFDVDTERGRIYVFAGRAGGLAAPQIINHPDAAEVHFGRALAIGDLDADGYPDLVVSSHRTELGRARVFRGGLPAVDLARSYLITDAAATSTFGKSLASGRDLDGDGLDDLVLGDPQRSAAQIYLGRPVGPPARGVTLLDSGTTAFGSTCARRLPVRAPARRR